MPKRTVPDLKELFKQAAEIAQEVPETMHEAAFNRAIDLLTGNTANKGGRSPAPMSKSAIRATKSEKIDGIKKSETVDMLLNALDSTQHPGVRSAAKVLDRALMVLKIALSEQKVGGLSTTDIARILTDKFRIRTTRQAVGRALEVATDLVNRVPQGRGLIYRIMGPGEEYLEHLGKEDKNAPRRQGQTTRKGRSRNTKKTTPSGEKDNKASSSRKNATRALNKSTAKGKAKSKGAVGPKAAIVALIESGFFGQARTGPEVQSYLKKKRGYDLGTDQLRLAMLRLVRDGELERDEKEDGQYEYTKPKS